MKPRIAAILSIGGVLVAGSAAALVNTNVLESDDRPTVVAAASGSSTSAPTSAGGDSSAPTSSAPTSSSSSSTSRPTTTRVATTGGSSSSTTRIVSVTPTTQGPGVFQLADGGTVTLSSANGVLTIVSVSPAPGWEVHEAEQESPHKVDVRVRNDQREVRFEATLLFGVINTSVRIDER
jgi:hypothetical protein